MLLSITSNAQPQHSTFATISTSEGNIKLELFAEKAPVTVKNFVDYANEHFFEGTIFHRVIPGFMIQGGGFTPDMARKATKAPIHNEADNGLHNNRGTIAMARTNDPNSATSQFFINVENNNPLDFSLTNPGYAVFGKVVSGMDIVDKIAATSTGRSGYFNDVPLKPIIINNVTIE
ncbi:MAG: peptidyl-prolyl cis-trans isomerase [Hahellaceae bacterium]|nr:peptidyl-prolyl cis-trans isomerase [Hahellaceae bacterium]